MKQKVVQKLLGPRITSAKNENANPNPIGLSTAPAAEESAAAHRFINVADTSEAAKRQGQRQTGRYCAAEANHINETRQRSLASASPHLVHYSAANFRLLVKSVAASKIDCQFCDESSNRTNTLVCTGFKRMAGERYIFLLLKNHIPELNFNVLLFETRRARM